MNRVKTESHVVSSRRAQEQQQRQQRARGREAISVLNCILDFSLSAIKSVEEEEEENV